MSEIDNDSESINEAEEAKIDSMSYSELRQYHETTTKKNREEGLYSWVHGCLVFENTLT